MIGLLASGTQMLVRSLLDCVAQPKKKKHVTASGCEIPEPCWYPQDEGEACSRACPRSTASLRLRVVNAGPTVRTFHLESEPGVTLDPVTLELGPRESASVSATFSVDNAAYEGEEKLLHVWVRGCRSHYVRWRVVVAAHDSKPVEVRIEDRPDYVHHWYDHFYCAHPCLGEQRR